MTGLDAQRQGEGEDLALGSFAFGQLIMRYRLPILILSVLLCLAAGAGVVFLKFDPDTKLFFAEDSKARVELERIEDKYAIANNVIFIVTSKSGDIFQPANLQSIADATRDARKVPFSLRTESISNFQLLNTDNDELGAKPLLRPGAIDAAEAKRVRAEALSNRDVAERLVSKTADVATIHVHVSRPRKSSGEVSQIAEVARALARDISAKNPDLEVRLSGGVLGDLAFAEAGVRDITTLVPIMTLIILVILAIGVRSATVTFVTSVVIALTVLATMGLFGWAGATLNVLTGAAPSIIMTMFFADCVHFVMAAVQQQAHGRDKLQSIVETVRINMMPTVVKSVTSIVGFLALNFSDSPPLNQIGNMVAIGSIIGCFLTVTLIPVMMSYLPMPKYRAEGETHGAFKRFAEFVVARNRHFLYGALALFVVTAAFIPSLKINDNFIRYFDESFAFRTDTDYLEKKVAGLQVMMFSIPSGEPEGVMDPGYLKRLDTFAEWYRKQPNVAHVDTMADVIKRMHRTMNGDKPEFDVIPDDRKLIAQYIILFELTLPPGQSLGSLIDISRSESLMAVRLGPVTSNDIRAAAESGRKWLVDNKFAEGAAPTGISVMYSYLTKTNIEAMNLGTAISVLLVSLIMGAALRDWRLGLISLVVNLAPAAIAFGLWSIIGAEVNLAIAIVTSMTYGIVTDDTVHTMAKYRWARETLGMSPYEASRETLTYTGAAVIMSSVALAIGFVILGFSAFNITAVMGILSALIICLAAAAELFVLPGLLVLFDRSRP